MSTNRHLAAGLVAIAIVAPNPVAARKAADGKPTIATDEPEAIFIWHDGGGWHLRGTSPSKPAKAHAFQGVIRTFGGAMGPAKPTPGASNPHLSVSGGALHFDFTVAKGVAGFDWNGDGECMTFEARIDGQPRFDRIYVGAKRDAPSATPFDACR